MSPANRPGGRERRTVSGGGNAYRRGSGLGSGSVGEGPRGSSGGSFGGGGDRGSGGGGLLAVLLALLIGGATNNNGNGTNKRGCFGRILVLILIVVGLVLVLNMCSGSTSGNLLNTLLGDYTNSSTDTGLSSVDTTDNTTGSSSSSSAVSDALGSLLGSYGSTSGQIAPASGSDEVYKAHEPNREVSTAAREKFTDTAATKTVTVMVYMCGTDLESKSGMATSDLEEMVNATLGSNINVILETGGASNWQNQIIKSNTNQRFRIKQGGLETLDAKVGKRSMVDPATLSDFIQFSAREYPADRYILVLWDHGGGSLTGYGYDELFPGESMSLDGINTALKDGGVKFDIIGFDACLMATLETALVTSQYSDYLVASEAVEPGTGWYYTNWLSELSDNPAMDSLDVGKQIVDDYVKMSGESSQTTLSMTDLAELEATVPATFKAFSSSTSELIAGDGFNTVATARSGSRDFSTSSKINQIDLIHFADNLATAESNALAATLREAVKYNRNSTTISHANGLSIYFPYQSLRSVSTAIKTYNAIGLDKSYSDCIKSFASVAAGGQVASGSSENPLGTLTGDNAGSLLGTLLGGTTSSSDTASATTDTVTQLLELFLKNKSVVTGDKDSSWVDDNLVRGSVADYQKNNAGFANLILTYKGETPTLVLTEEQWSSVVTLEQNVYVDDGTGYIDLGLDNVADYDSDNDLIMSYDGTWLSLNGQIVSYYLVSEDQVDDSYTILGRVPAMLNGTRVNIILRFTSENPNGEVLGAQYDYAATSTDTIMKGLVEIAAGDKIDFLCDYYNYDGTFNDAYYLGEQMTATGQWEIGNAPLGDNVNWDMAYRITDIYGGQYWTPTVKNY